jgi:hypothetical protein
MLFEKKVLRRIFGPKKDEVMRGWQKLRNEDPHNLYSSPSIIRMIKSRRMRWAGYVARVGAKRNAYRIMVGKPEGKRCRWLDSIKVDLRDIGWGGMDWIELAEGCFGHGTEPLGSIKCWEFLE